MSPGLNQGTEKFIFKEAKREIGATELQVFLDLV